jgi:hypothetical protein
MPVSLLETPFILCSQWFRALTSSETGVYSRVAGCHSCPPQWDICLESNSEGASVMELQFSAVIELSPLRLEGLRAFPSSETGVLSCPLL